MEFVLGSPRSPALPASLRYRFRARLEGMIHNLSVSQRGLRMFAKPDSARGGTHLGIVFCISLPPTSLTTSPFFGCLWQDMSICFLFVKQSSGRRGARTDDSLRLRRTNGRLFQPF